MTASFRVMALLAKYIISCLFKSKKYYVANGATPESVQLVEDEKDACYFQYSQEVVGIFASITAGYYCDITYANQCETPADVSLIENASFQEELMLTRRGQVEKSQLFYGWTFVS